MPKIIENVQENLLREARKQVLEQGYSAMTIRSVASACGISIGTVYNYFPSKDMLVASFMLEDWQTCMEAIRKCSEEYVNPKIVLKCVYEELKIFTQNYMPLFQDENAEISFASAFPKRHRQLRGQIANLLQKICAMQDKADADFLAEFLAENMLTWTLANKTFEEISNILLQLF